MAHGAFEMNMQLSQLHATFSDSRLAEAAFSDPYGLAIARPRWRCETQKSQRLIAKGPKLKRAAGRDEHRRARGHARGLAADPDLTSAVEEVPDLFHGSMLHRPAHASGAEHHLDQARALRTQLAKVDLRAVGRDRVGFQLFQTGFRFSTNAEMPS